MELAAGGVKGSLVLLGSVVVERTSNAVNNMAHEPMC